MAKPQDLREIDRKKFKEFLDSFDVILTDCDGVIWFLSTPIEGAIETLNLLKTLGKKIFFVSNNSLSTVEQYCQKLESSGFQATPNQIIIPAKVIAWYLKKLNFDGEVFTIGSTPFQKVLKDSGIKLADSPPLSVMEELSTVREQISDRPSIKAVVCDFDLDCNWIKLTRAILSLQKQNTIFLMGAQDKFVPFSKNVALLGPGPLTNIVTELSGRNPIPCAKPSKVLKDFILEQCEINDPKRCLFIGDSPDSDMQFGTMCNFQKLFVESGTGRLEECTKCAEITPDYYLPELSLLLPVLRQFLEPSRN
ncbi:4-nitrophenylphosphatase [Orussus abietinus]|uniref:4-nitrophenylphosphatase n=1 Tax=Orussus abietinus TaxID=222816 RepID=UPI000626CA6A|nr:4-nitrophenylphosphatase [Orussus abietinus]